MKIIMVEDFFHPSAGYQINILPKYLVQMGHQVIIITSQMDKIPQSLKSYFEVSDLAYLDESFEQKYKIKIIRVPIRFFISGRSIYYNNVFNITNDFVPDLLYLHGSSTYLSIRFVLKARRLQYPIVLDDHMLEMASQNRFSKWFLQGYRTFVTPIIAKRKIPVIRTQDDPYVQKCLGIPLAQAPFISHASDIALFHPDSDMRCDFRQSYDIGDDDFVVLYTGKLDEAKGGKLLATTFQTQFNCEKRVVLIVVGNTTGDYGREVEAIFNSSQNRVIRFPTQKYVDLPQFYQAADLAVFARQCSLSFYDAQACGLPVVSEDNNINVERCKHQNGRNFKANDMEDFRSSVEWFVNMPSDMYRLFSDNAYQFVMKDYSYADKAKEYEQVLLAALDAFNS